MSASVKPADAAGGRDAQEVIDGSGVASPVPVAGPSAHVPLLVLLTLSHVVVDAYATTVPALLPFWQARFALSYGLAGLITGISNVTSSVAQPLVGVLTDRGRNPRWIVLACLVAAVGISSTGLITSYPLFLAVVVFGGLGVSGFHPQGYKQVGLYAGQKPAIATSWFLVGGNVGVALGPLLGTAFALRFGPVGTVALFPMGALLALALWLLLPRWTARSRTRHVNGHIAGVAAVDVPPVVAGLKSQRRLLAIAVLVAVVAARSTVSSSLSSFVPLYYVRYAGSGEGFASRVLSGMLLAGAVATLAGGYLADRWGRLRLIALSLVPVPVLLYAFVSLPAQSPLAIAVLWAAGALVTTSFSVTVVLAQELWYERRALASGVIVGFAFGMGGLFVPAVGSVADRWGLPQAFQVIAVLPLLSLLLVAILGVLLRSPSRSTPAVAGET